MIARIGPLVERVSQRERRNLLIMHVIGGSVGGFATGAVAGLVTTLMALLFDDWTEWLLYLSIGAFALAMMHDAGILRLPLPRNIRQTPGYLPCAVGDVPGIFLWGADLGTLVATRPVYACAMVLPLIAIATGDSTVCILTLTAFGSARAGSVVKSVIWAKGDYAERCTAIASTKRARAMAIAFIGVSLALMLAASVPR